MCQWQFPDNFQSGVGSGNRSHAQKAPRRHHRIGKDPRNPNSLAELIQVSWGLGSKEFRNFRFLAINQKRGPLNSICEYVCTKGGKVSRKKDPWECVLHNPRSLGRCCRREVADKRGHINIQATFPHVSLHWLDPPCSEVLCTHPASVQSPRGLAMVS